MDEDYVVIEGLDDLCGLMQLNCDNESRVAAIRQISIHHRHHRQLELMLMIMVVALVMVLQMVMVLLLM
jgi:N-acetylglutamate synthase-like GNAT family acetyltransferase